MFNNKIKFWFIYSIIIISIQMFLFGIYNIPIYKLYCELNNYYSFNIISNFFNSKIYLFNSSFLNYNNYFFSSYNNINFYYDINSFFKIYQKINNINLLNINNIYLESFKNNYNFLNSNSIQSFINNLFDISFFYENNINCENIIYVIYFNTSVTSINIVEFISLQNHVYIYSSETYLVFFRLYNPTDFLIKGISIYTINPNEMNAYIYKIQCFCFDEIILYPFESIDLPILFYISSNTNNYLNFESIYFFQIQIIYLFILNSFNIK